MAVEWVLFQPGRRGDLVGRASDGRIVLPRHGWRPEPGEGYWVELSPTRAGTAYIGSPASGERLDSDTGYLRRYRDGQLAGSVEPSQVIRMLESGALKGRLAQEARQAFTCPACGRLDSEVPRLGKCLACFRSAEQAASEAYQASRRAWREAAEEALRKAAPYPERLPERYVRPSLPVARELPAECLGARYENREVISYRREGLRQEVWDEDWDTSLIHPVPRRREFRIITLRALCPEHGELDLLFEGTAPETVRCPACEAARQEAVRRIRIRAVWLSQADLRWAAETVLEDFEGQPVEAVVAAFRERLRRLARERRVS